MCKALADAGIVVKSVVFEGTDRSTNKQIALLRLPPLPLPWQLSEEDLAVPLIPDIEQEAQQPDEAPAAESADADAEKGSAEGGAAEPATETAGEAAAADDAAAQEGDKKEEPVPATPSKSQQQIDDGRRDGDVTKLARYMAAKINERNIKLGEDKLAAEAVSLNSTLFVGNVTEGDDEKVRADMSQFGSLERCYIMRNGVGQSKVGS